jgi:hypothetical protein
VECLLLKGGEIRARVELHIRIGKSTNASHCAKVLQLSNLRILERNDAAHMIESPVLLHEKNYMFDILDRARQGSDGEGEESNQSKEYESLHPF